MGYDAHSNFGYSTVATAPSPADTGTSLVVQAGDGVKFPTPPFNVTIWPANAQPTTANAEIARVTVVSTDTLTITRAQESSSARTVIVGDQIAVSITAKVITDIETQSPFATQQYQVLTSGASPFTPVYSGFLIDGTTGGKTVLAVTSAKTLTLTATDTFNLTIPATGTAALGTGAANQVAYWSATNTITGNTKIVVDVSAAGVFVLAGTDSGIRSSANTDELLIGDSGKQGYLLMPGTNFGATEDGSFLFTSRYIAAQASNANIVFRTYDGSTVSELMFLDRLGNVGVGGLSARTSPVFRALVSCNVGIGTTAPDKVLEINSATGACLRLTYNDATGSAATCVDLAVTSAGVLTITPTNTASTPAVTVAYGLHVGGVSDPGDNNLLVDGTATVTGNAILTDKITTYNNVATEGYGVGAIVDDVALTSQGADIAATNFTNANAAGQYLVGCYIQTTTIGTATLDIQLIYTDLIGARTIAIISSFNTSGSNRTQATHYCRMASGNLQYAVVATSGNYDTSRYAIHFTCMRLS